VFIAVVVVLAQRKQKPETKQKRKRKFSSTFFRLQSKRRVEEGKEKMK